MLKTIPGLISLFLFISVPSAFASEMVRGAGILAGINIIENVTRDFNKKNPEVTLTHRELKGAADVIAAVGKGERTWGVVNRSLNDKEKEQFADIQTHLFAKDGIVFVVHPDNPVTAITKAQLKDIFQGKITDWSQIGGKKGVISPMMLRDKRHVARTAVEKYVLGKEKMAIGKVREMGNQGELRDDVILDKSSLGYLLMSGAGKKVKMLELDGFVPKKADVKTGTYPLAASWFIITKGDPSPAMQKFMEFLYSAEGGKLVEKGKVTFIPRASGQ